MSLACELKVIIDFFVNLIWLGTLSLVCFTGLKGLIISLTFSFGDETGSALLFCLYFFIMHGFTFLAWIISTWAFVYYFGFLIELLCWSKRSIFSYFEPAFWTVNISMNLAKKAMWLIVIFSLSNFFNFIVFNFVYNLCLLRKILFAEYACFTNYLRLQGFAFIVNRNFSLTFIAHAFKTLCGTLVADNLNFLGQTVILLDSWCCCVIIIWIWNHVINQNGISRTKCLQNVILSCIIIKPNWGFLHFALFFNLWKTMLIFSWK